MSGRPACALMEMPVCFPAGKHKWALGLGLWQPSAVILRGGHKPPRPPIPQASQRERGPPACSPAGMGSPLSKDGAHPGRGQAHPGRGWQVSSRSPERALHWSEATQRPARGHAGPQGPGPTGRRLRRGGLALTRATQPRPTYLGAILASSPAVARPRGAATAPAGSPCPGRLPARMPLTASTAAGEERKLSRAVGGPRPQPTPSSWWERLTQHRS